MKFRHTDTEHKKIRLQMTPMIDIVFQLLVFFIMTFRIVSQEGDFNIRMPTAAVQPGPVSPDLELPPMHVRLVADSAGELAGIYLNDEFCSSFEQLRNRIIAVVGSDVGPGSARESAEVELEADYHLRYEMTIAAVTAVSGYVDPRTGRVVKLVERIRLTPPE